MMDQDIQDLMLLSPTGLAKRILDAIAQFKEHLMDGIQQLNDDLVAIKAYQSKTFEEIQATKATVTTLQATIADLEAQLGAANVPPSLLALAASARVQAQQIDDLLPDLPPALPAVPPIV
jgi:septal ring factor EnvC (AmiA/AmiB activator)